MGDNKMSGKKNEEKTKNYILILDVLEKAVEDDVAKEKLRDILDDEQIQMIENLKEGKLEHDNRWIAYMYGFNASDIGRATNYTRANITVRIGTQITGRKEEITNKHRENRKKLYQARDWYLYVYLSDKLGDFRQMKEYLPKSRQDDTFMYWKYKELGGEKIDKDFVDRRHMLEEAKKKDILEGLKKYPLERVAFQERIYPENVTRIAEDAGVKYFLEKDVVLEDGTVSTEYRDKLNLWLEKKRMFNMQDSKKRSEELREKRVQEEK